jgi:uncharacterized protein (UPF0548 family)
MKHLQLRTNVDEEVLKFVKGTLPSLGEGRIEISKDRNGVVISELISFEPGTESQKNLLEEVV